MRRILRWVSLLLMVLIALLSVVQAIPPLQENLFQQTLLNVRNDVELLADFVYGGGTRPDEWKANTDAASESMLADLWFDNELLADEIYGLRLRPLNWIGATSTNGEIVARNIRHDLELAADVQLGDIRPDEWIGGPRLYRCDRTLMNTVYILDIVFNVRPTTPEAVRVYCPTIEDEIEDTLLEEALTGDEVDANALPSLILEVRGDLERLADETRGVNNRPPGWIDNTDVESFSLAGDLFTDLESLADVLIEPGIRPGGWIGSTQTSLLATFRNLRHDLELLADIELGEGSRPHGWEGAGDITRCEPLLQSLVYLAQDAYGYSLPEIETTNRVEYCSQIERTTNFIVENPPSPDDPDYVDVTEEVDPRYVGESEIAFSYLDPAATQYMGMMPRGTQFRAWYRNFGGSTMMFVSGEDFALFIDRRWTTLPQNVFNTLPTLEGVRPLTYCDALWCNGPGPTPTPTGDGPIIDILLGSTPPAEQVQITPDADTADKQPVSWNHLRVNYVLQRQDIGKVQVTLEICREPNQIVCEPVLAVFDTALNQALAPVSQFNGLNVYELPYGYSTQFVIEGATYFSRDIWLNDPTLTGE